MTLDYSVKELLKIIGSPAEVDRELREFERSASVLSSRRARLIKHYPRRWVAVYQGKVMADAPTFVSILEQIDKEKLPREQVIVRFIDKSERAMIL